MIRTRSLAVSAAVVAGLVAAGTPAAPAAGQTASGGLRLTAVSGGSPYQPGCAQPQPGEVVPGTELQVTAAVNPRNPQHIIAAWQQDHYLNGASSGVFGKVSRDGGRHWTPMRPPPFSICAGGTEANGGKFDRGDDHWLTFGPNGDAYFLTLAVDFTTDRNAMLVSKSTDGGVTWGPITNLRGGQGGIFEDKTAILADTRNSRYAYAVWDEIHVPDNVGRTFIARTTDGGRSWEPARVIYDPGAGTGAQTYGNRLIQLGDGTLVIVFLFIDAQLKMHLQTMRSTDRGSTWTAPSEVDAMFPRGIPGGAFDPRDGQPLWDGAMIPEAAADQRPGHRDLYVVWQDSRFTNGERDSTAFVASHDGGLTWSPTRRLSLPESQQAFLPKVAVNDRGEVGVTYYDFTYDTVDSVPLQTDVWITRSRDGGTSFAPRRRLTSRSFDFRHALARAEGLFLGDFTGMVASGSVFVPFFGVTTNDPANQTDIMTTRVSFGSGGYDLAAPTAPATRPRSLQHRRWHRLLDQPGCPGGC